MAWLIRLAGLRDLRRDDGVSDVSATVLGDGMSVENKFWHKAAISQSKWVQQMESENELARSLIEKLEWELAESREREIAFFEANEGLGESCRAAHAQLDAEKALADDLYIGSKGTANQITKAWAAYRKARGME